MDKMQKTKEIDSTLSKKTYVAPQMTVEYIEHQGTILTASCGHQDGCIEDDY